MRGSAYPTDFHVTVFLLCLAALQGVALLVLMARLAPGRTRRPPVPPKLSGGPVGGLTILLPAYNEAARIRPCLEGLLAQGPAVERILVIESRSRDGTADVVREYLSRDPRLVLLHDPPLPTGWVGKAWALQYGTEQATTPYVLGVDADIVPAPGMADAILDLAQGEHFDVLSFSPKFRIPSAAERWLQPALLTTLVYRTGAAGEQQPDPDRIAANGQCMLFKREVILRAGYGVVAGSFSEDVSIARHLARQGAKVGFLDGSSLYTVKSYETAAQAWREWGRSLDLKDARTPAGQAWDVAHLWLAQAAPWVVLPLVAWGPWSAAWPPALRSALLWVNGLLLGIRVMLLLATRGSYERADLPYWLSPLADPLAALRITLSSLRRPKAWRGRVYGS
jgi:dolichol-phosphate mannosyltransferase